MAKEPNWTPQEIEVLTQYFSSQRGTMSKLVLLLPRRSPQAIRNKANKMGLSTRPQPRKPWMKNEDEWLMENVERLSFRELCAHLHRGENSIKNRMRELRLTKSYRDGWFTMHDVAEVLGSSRKRVLKLIEDGKLKARRRATGADYQIDSETRCAVEITTRDLRDFIKAYPGELQGRPVDMVSVVQVLVGDA